MSRLTSYAAMLLCLAMSACLPVQEISFSADRPAISPSRSPATAASKAIPAPSATKTQVRPSATSSATKTVPPTAAPQETVTATATPTAQASHTPRPSPTPYPTPANLPPAADGWRWELHATEIPVTHYIIYELSAEDWEAPVEHPYGLDDQPLAGVEPLPRPFLEQVAYQGSGRLPDGSVLQYAAVRPPVERDLVPYRYVIIPAERCESHPRAGNGTCSVPLETAATTWGEDEGALVPVGSTIFIPELNRKIRINDVAITEGAPKIDLYTGTVNNYDYERPDGATIWILTEEPDPAGAPTRATARGSEP